MLSDLAMEYSDNTGINEYAIMPVKENQSFYGPIYTLKAIELETLKTYIKIHLKTGFIYSSKSLADTSIFFNKKLNDSFRMCADYWNLNNLNIKN